MGITSAYLTEQPESPQKTGEKDGKTITRIYKINNSLVDELDNIMPATGTFDDSTERDGYFMRYRTVHGPGYTTVYVDYVSDKDHPGVDSKINLEVRYDLSINIVEKMLEEATNRAGNNIYRTKWNYDLYELAASVDATPSSVPVWWTSATNFDDAKGTVFYWAKEKPADPSNGSGVWILNSKRTKPGVEAYVIAQAVISEKKYCKRKTEAIAFLKTGINLSEPSERFGWPSGATRWLAYPIGIQNDGKFWVAVNEYHYADVWDTDLYEALS